MNFTASEECAVCGVEFSFTVDAALAGRDKNIITPIEEIACPECGAKYRFDAERQEWTNVEADTGPRR